MPALQAVVRGLVTSAAKGSGPAQRMLIEKVQGIEREGNLMQAAMKQKAETEKPVSDLDAARRIAFLLSKASLGSEQSQPSPSVKHVGKKKNRRPAR
jgi:hypothetical protein